MDSFLPGNVFPRQLYHTSLLLKVLSWWQSTPATERDMGLILSSGRSPEKKMATHSNVLAWEIPWTEDPGGLHSMGSQRVRHNLATEHTRALFKYLSSFSLSFSQWPCHLQIQRWDKIWTVSYFYRWFHHLTCICTHSQCLFHVYSVPAILSFLYWGHVLFHFHIRYFSSVQSLSSVQLFATPWTAAYQVSMSITNSKSLLKLISIKSVMPYNHLILCHPLHLPPSIFLSIGVFSNESVFPIWPKYWSFSPNPSNEYSGLIFFRMDWLDLLAVQGTLKSLL